MNDEDLPGDEHSDAGVAPEDTAPEPAASDESVWAPPAADAGAPDATATDTTSEVTAQIPVGAAGWGAESGPVATEPDPATSNWVASPGVPVGTAAVAPAAIAASSDERKGRSRSVLVGAIAGAVVGALVSSGVFLAVRDDSGRNTTTTVIQKAAKPASSVIKRSTDIHAVIAKVQPATVAITTGSAVSDAVPNADDSQFNTQQTGAAGTGFVISSDGYIGTNNHVNADSGAKIEITIDDGM